MRFQADVRGEDEDTLRQLAQRAGVRFIRDLANELLHLKLQEERERLKLVPVDEDLVA